MKLSEIAIDPVRYEKGAWIGDIPEFGGVRLHVRGLGCAEYRRRLDELREAVPRARRLAGRLQPADADPIQDQCLAEIILLGWEGLENEDGSPLQYTPEAAKRFLSDPAFKKFKDAVVYAASIVGEIAAEDQKAAVGNSAPPFAGS